MFFHEIAPESIVNLHSMEYTTTYSVFWRMLGVAVMAIPIFAFGMYVANKMGSILGNAVRDCPDQAHQLPGLLRYI